MKNMKQKLVVLALFILNFTNAQNVDFLKKANKCDIDFARQFSDEIISTTKTKYVYLKSVEANYLHLITFIYIKEGLNDDEIKSTEAYLSQYTGRHELQISDCLCIHFNVKDVGANPDLEIKGVKEYSFSTVVGNFLDLFPFYQKNIEPTATTEKTTTTGIYSVRKDAVGYWYNFRRSSTDGLWYLKNMSNY
jgi:hypothetical protein